MKKYNLAVTFLFILCLIACNRNNDYFEISSYFPSDVESLKYNGTLVFDDITETEVNLNIIHINNKKHGIIYEFKLDSTIDIPNGRSVLGYFFIKDNKIYKIDETNENIKKIYNNEDASNNSDIVCQTKEIKDQDDTNNNFHSYLQIKNDKCEYHSYNNSVETGYYEEIVWERNKGMIEYKSGFGAERESIKLTLS